MARIKAIMNERRLAYEGAVVLAEKQHEEVEDAAVLKFRVDQETTKQHKLHTEALRKKLVPRRTRTARAGVKVRERMTKLAEAKAEGVPPRKVKVKQPKPEDGEKIKKPRWNKAQKIAHALHKKRQAEGKPGDSKVKKRLHVA
jgi:hypothetical protein